MVRWVGFGCLHREVHSLLFVTWIMVGPFVRVEVQQVMQPSGGCVRESAVAANVSLAHLCLSLGIPFTIEHPRNSRAWALHETQLLLKRREVRLVPVDWCC